MKTVSATAHAAAVTATQRAPVRTCRRSSTVWATPMLQSSTSPRGTASATTAATGQPDHHG